MTSFVWVRLSEEELCFEVYTSEELQAKLQKDRRTWETKGFADLAARRAAIAAWAATTTVGSWLSVSNGASLLFCVHTPKPEEPAAGA